MKGGAAMRVTGVAIVLLGGLVLATSAMAAEPELGKKLWTQKCAMCHGADGKGNAKMAQTLKTTIADAGTWAAKPDSELLKTITDGRRPMPAFGKSLKPKELDAVLLHAKGLAKALAAGR
jgi:mono/diheme cytochrome c family protein